VPGLAAKPVIDSMALVDDLDAPIATLVERDEYAELKRRLADRFNEDREAYTEAKRAFVRRVEDAA
jgi:GrpB-like predicted nucleotidyltransferase (UPF0157 family)